MPPPPRVVVNLKTYPEATGKAAVLLAKMSLRLEDRYGVGIALVPQTVDVRACTTVGARCYAQSFDRVESSQSTGAVRWESLVDAGVEGALLNHSERRLELKELEWKVNTVHRSKLRTLLCAETTEEARHLARLAPTMLAIEPPALIGGDVSVTSADPGIVRDTVAGVRKIAPKLPVLCGAGVKDGKDAWAAAALGAYGILVASGVAKASSPSGALEDLVKGLESGKP